MAQSAEDLHAVQTANKNIRQALELARSTKTEHTIDPPLSVSQIQPIVDDLHLGFTNEDYSNFTAIETAARTIFYEQIKSTDITDPDFVNVWNLFDILSLAGDEGKCSPELVCWLIEELLDSQTTEGCRIVFNYLESRRERLAQKDFHKKNLVFLRACNELLRKLSRAEDAKFCGRVFFFLFQTFPLGDKSSVNLRGEFHLENTTIFDETIVSVEAIKPEETSTPTRPSKPGSKAVPIKAPKKEEEPLDSTALYPIFWKLQKAFSEPTTLFTSATFNDFKKTLNATIFKFKRTPTVVQTKPAEERRHLKRKAVEEHGVDNYNPKYLTSRDLFDLELSDLDFQRHILLQALILLDFLLSMTEKAKKKLLIVDHPNKSLLYDFTLSPEDTIWATETRLSIKQLFYTMPEGRYFDRMVDTILARDKNWVKWKIESCPSIVKDAISIDEISAVRQSVIKQTKTRRVDARPMGAMDLSFLEDGQGTGLDSLRDASRYTAADQDSLLKGIETDKLDLEMAMTDEEKTGLENTIQNKTWRLFRTTRSSRLGVLANTEPGKDLAIFHPAQIDTIESVS